MTVLSLEHERSRDVESDEGLSAVVWTGPNWFAPDSWSGARSDKFEMMVLPRAVGSKAAEDKQKGQDLFKCWKPQWGFNQWVEKRVDELQGQGQSETKAQVEDRIYVPFEVTHKKQTQTTTPGGPRDSSGVRSATFTSMETIEYQFELPERYVAKTEFDAAPMFTTQYWPKNDDDRSSVTFLVDQGPVDDAGRVGARYSESELEAMSERSTSSSGLRNRGKFGRKTLKDLEPHDIIYLPFYVKNVRVQKIGGKGWLQELTEHYGKRISGQLGRNVGKIAADSGVVVLDSASVAARATAKAARIVATHTQEAANLAVEKVAPVVAKGGELIAQQYDDINEYISMFLNCFSNL